MKEKQHLSGSQSTYLWLYVPVAEGWGLGGGAGLRLDRDQSRVIHSQRVDIFRISSHAYSLYIVPTFFLFLPTSEA